MSVSDNSGDVNEFGVVGTGDQQVDALKLFAYSRNIPGTPKPRLKLPGDGAQIGGFAKAFWMMVRQRGVFRRDSATVLINDDKKRLDYMEPHMLQVWSDEVVDCYKNRVSKDADGNLVSSEAIRSMPVDLTRSLLGQVKVQPTLLEEIEKMNQVSMPIVREDGRIELLAPGYDVLSSTFTFDCGFALDQEMTIEAAKAHFDELLSEFPFGDGVDDPNRSKAVQIACMLTLFASGLLPRGAARPMFLFNANAQRSGKSLLAKLALLTVFGRAGSTSWSENREEFRKSLETAANTASPYIFFDNCKGYLANSDLERFVTSPHVTCRVMGKNTEELTVPNVATVLITSNNATTSTDIAERSLIVNLFVQEADAQARRINNFLDEVRISQVEMRRKSLGALWAFVRHWVAQGKPRGEARLVGFEEWSAVIGGIVTTAGFADPLARPNISGVGDTLGQAFAKLVARLMVVAMHDEDGANAPFEVVENGRSFTFSQLAKICADHGMFEDYVPDDGEMKANDRSKFGKYLRKYIGKGRAFTVNIESDEMRVFLSDNGESGRAKRFLVTQMG